MELLNRLISSFVFWGAWILIPVIMEIVPAVGAIHVLFKKRRKARHNEKSRAEEMETIMRVYPEISILIPVYNSQETLDACIRSINDSDYPNERIRIFLINNQGKDDSFSVFCKAQELYPDLYMQWLNSKQGKSKALNLALFNSGGKYIINIDSDGILEKSALKNMIYKFEKDTDIDVVTGAILIQPELIEKYPFGLPRLLRKVEFMEYAQAFLAGRNYAAEFDAIYTLSGAFSAFRKSAVLKSRMYNPDTITEDTEITFQMKYQFNKKVHICEDALFFVDPIENLNKLYTQRQRWQRGSLEVSNMFLKDKMKPQYMFFNSAVRTLLYDHTFAFPRLIWYLALLCLCFMNYGFTMIVFSTAILFVLYIVVGFFYYFSTIGYLKHFPDIRSYYRKQWYAVFFLPFFNFVVFFIRFAGVINSINVDSSWKTKNFTEEKQTFRETVEKDFATVNGILEKIRNYVNVE